MFSNLNLLCEKSDDTGDGFSLDALAQSHLSEAGSATLNFGQSWYKISCSIDMIFFHANQTAPLIEGI